jgi:hypothetical protein
MTHALAHRPSSTRPASGWIWFAVMIGSWGIFFALALFRQTTLSNMWQTLQELPLVAEGMVWLLFFPLVLATAVWESSWPVWLRFLLVGCFAVAWSLAFFPRVKTREDAR